MSLALVVASVAVVFGAGAVTQQLATSDDHRSVAPSTGTVPTAPSGMRLVGRGRAVMAVPERWTQNQDGCTTSSTGNVAFLPVPPRSCRAPNLSIPMQPTLGISALTATPAALGTFEPVEGSVGAVAEAALCLESEPTSCSQRIAVPSEDVLFTLTWWRTGDGEATVAQVRESLQLLPEGYTTVPFVAPGTPRSEAEEIVAAAGLKPSVNADDVDLPITGTEPAAGSVVRAPSEVALLLEPGGPPIEGTWTALLSGITADGRLDDLYRDTRFTLTFVDGELRGDDECNSFGADYSQVGRDLAVGPIESTAIGCETTEVIVRVLNDVRHVTGSRKLVYLHADNWGILLSLRPVTVTSGSSSPRGLTCPTEMRAAASPPFFDETAPGATTPEGAVETWLAGPVGKAFGPEYVMDANKRHAWLLRPDGTAEARVTVKLTIGGGYLYYGHEACG